MSRSLAAGAGTMRAVSTRLLSRITQLPKTPSVLGRVSPAVSAQFHRSSLRFNKSILPRKVSSNLSLGQEQKELSKSHERFRASSEQDLWYVAVLDSNQDLKITHPGSENTLVLNRQWLRDTCGCEKCVDPHSGQKTYSTVSIPNDPPIKNAERLEDGSLEVVWEKDFHSLGQAHVSRYAAATIKSWFAGRNPKDPLPPRILWDKNIFSESPFMVQYDDWISGGSGFHAALAQLHNYGLVFVDGVPESEDSVVSIANQIGNTMETFYGRTWDVRSKPEAENVAYTNSFLGLHQDLLYTKDPPRIQLLHCLENTCEGGESIFSDAMRVVQLMHLQDREMYHTLTETRLLYHYKKHGQHYEQRRSVIDGSDKVAYWSPPFQAIDQRLRKTENGSDSYHSWMQAAKRFRDLLEDERGVYEYKMKPGQCVIFDNLRVLHGRRQFDTTSGSRWLKGTYLSSDVWKSKRTILGSEILASGKNSLESLPRQAQKLASRPNQS